jgi:hypothetical protein
VVERLLSAQQSIDEFSKQLPGSRPMALFDFIDKHYRAMFIVGAVFALLSYLTGWVTSMSAMTALTWTMSLVGLLRASRDMSRGDFPDC